MPAAGRLDRYVTLLRESTTGHDSLNEPVMEWIPVRRFKAERINKSEDERFAVEQRYGVRVVTFRARWFEGIAETDRIECEGLEYDIKGLKELGRRRDLDIAAEARPS